MALGIESVYNSDNKIVLPKFYPLAIKELQVLREAGILNASSYVYLHFKCDNPFGRKSFTFSIKALAFELGLPTSTLSDALKKLENAGLIKIRKQLLTIDLVLTKQEKKSNSQQQAVNENNPNGFGDRKPKRKSKNKNGNPKTKTENQKPKRKTVQVNGKSDFESPKPAPEAEAGTSKILKTNLDFLDLDLESKEKKITDYWLDDEETNTKVDEFKQELERQQATTSQELERQQAFLDKLEENNNTVEGELVQEQVETVSTSDNNSTTSLATHSSYSQGEIPSACSTFETKFKHRAANPKQTNLDRLREDLNWIPEGVWCTAEGKLDPQFVNWICQWWIAEFGGNEHEARWKVISYFKNDLSRLPLRWEEYSATYLAKYKNADLRLSHGCKVGEKEEEELKSNVRAVTKPLPPEMSCEDKGLLSPKNNPTALRQEEATAGIQQLLQGTPAEKNALLTSEESNSAGINLKNSTSSVLLEGDNSQASSIPQDEHGSVSVQSYAQWQPKQEKEPLATKEQWNALKGKLAKFQKSFGKGLKPEKTQEQKLRDRIKRLNEDLGDPILRPEAIAAAKEEGLEIIANKFGDVVAIDLPF